MADILEHVSLPEAVGRALRRRILNNELPAETRLVEANLAAEFGVSRGTIRDAMRSLQAEGLIVIVPRRYSVVTRMSPADAEDVCYARYVLEDASVESGLGTSRRELVRTLRIALEHMAAAARTDDVDALVASDTQFHELLIDVSGRRRLKDLWGMLNSQMGGLMREEIDRQGIGLMEAVDRHRGILEAVTEGDITRLRQELKDHYLMGFPAPGELAPSPPGRAGDT
ncbi:MAG TPA: GntR family transcriptional regulator [Streptosporangiaceae bacterium]|jgi:DNA-binding GntR family transcriptional regulator|nr:GntR family transcriptional regulator [Streptosporangiaceae bacterium]